MESEPEVPLTRIAAFVRQHTHDVRNGLNCLDLEASYLQDLISDSEAAACVARIRRQVREMAEEMRALSGMFQEPHPIAAPLAASELFLIWKDQQTAAQQLAIEWSSQLADEMVQIDAELAAAILRELLVNAAASEPAATVRAAAYSSGGNVVFELREPKPAAVDPEAWGSPFSTGGKGYGLGLWDARRKAQASGGRLTQLFDPEAGELVSRLAFPAI